jgi:glycosyltransferase involved in cell wall biosynthesis
MQFWGDPKRSWASGRSYDFAHHWAKIPDVTVDVITSDAYDLTSAPKIERIGNLTVHRLHQPYKNIMSWLGRVFSFFLFWLKAFKKALELSRTDVIYASATPYTIPVLGILLSKLFRCRCVIELRDLWPDYPIEVMQLNGITVKLLREIEHWLYKNADHIVVLSPQCKEVIQKRTLTPVSVFPNGTTDYEKNITDSEKREKKKQIIYAGALGWANGTDKLLDFFTEILAQTDLDIIIFGEGTERYKLEKMTDKLPESQCGRVSLNNYLPRNEVVKHCSESLFSVCSFTDIETLKSNSPNKLFDSIAVGTPVIVLADGYSAELLKKYNFGLIGTDYVQLSKEIRNLDPDKQQYIKLKRSCNHASRIFSRSMMAEAIFNTIILSILHD